MGKLKEVLAFVNNKGGVGKTTTVQSVAAGILRLNKKAKVLCIDLDPQGNMSFLMGWEKVKADYSPALTVADALRDGSSNSLPVYKKSDRWYYVPASSLLNGIDPDLHRQMQSKLVLCQLFGNEFTDMSGDFKEGTRWISESFDYVLIDCAPSLSELTYNALGASTGVIIPVQLEGLSVSGIGKILKACKDVRKMLNPDLEVRGLLLAMADERTNMTKDMVKYLRDTYDEIVFDTRIRRCVKVAEAQLQLRNIFEYAPYCTAGIDYEAFVKELKKTYKA
jgi:chromosome partitioning protein